MTYVPIIIGNGSVEIEIDGKKQIKSLKEISEMYNNEPTTTIK